MDDNTVSTQQMVQTQYVYVDSSEKPMELGDWILLILMLKIPCIGFLLLLVWALGSGNVNRKRFCQATILVSLLGFMLKVLLFIILLYTGTLSLFLPFVFLL